MQTPKTDTSSIYNLTTTNNAIDLDQAIKVCPSIVGCDSNSKPHAILHNKLSIATLTELKKLKDDCSNTFQIIKTQQNSGNANIEIVKSSIESIKNEMVKTIEAMKNDVTTLQKTFDDFSIKLFQCVKYSNVEVPQNQITGATIYNNGQFATLAIRANEKTIKLVDLATQ